MPKNRKNEKGVHLPGGKSGILDHSGPFWTRSPQLLCPAAARMHRAGKREMVRRPCDLSKFSRFAHRRYGVCLEIAVFHGALNHMKSNKKHGSRTRCKGDRSNNLRMHRFAIHEAFTQNSMGISWAFLGPMFKDKPQAMTATIQAQCLRERPPLRDSDGMTMG